MPQTRRQPWARVTPPQLKTLQDCDRTGGNVKAFVPTATILSLVYKGYLENTGNGWYSLTQRGRDFLRFGAPGKASELARAKRLVRDADFKLAVKVHTILALCYAGQKAARHQAYKDAGLDKLLDAAERRTR
jgi:hypothetical protein